MFQHGPLSITKNNKKNVGDHQEGDDNVFFHDCLIRRIDNIISQLKKFLNKIYYRYDFFTRFASKLQPAVRFVDTGSFMFPFRDSIMMVCV